MDDAWKIEAALAYGEDYPGEAAFNDSIREIEIDYATPGAEIISLVVEGNLAAGAMVRPNLLLENCFELTWVFVAKKYRGRGYAVRIISDSVAKIESELLKGERGSIIIAALDRNASLYEKFGFERGARLHDGITMVRIANPGAKPSRGSSVHAV